MLFLRFSDDECGFYAFWERVFQYGVILIVKIHFSAVESPHNPFRSWDGKSGAFHPDVVSFYAKLGSVANYGRGT